MAALLHDGSLTVGKAQKVMNFLHEMGIGGATSQSHGMALDLLEKESKGRSEAETTRLKEAIKKLEAEKEAGLVQFCKLLKKASDLELRVLSAEGESRALKEQAGKYDADKISCLEKKLLEAEDHAKRVDDRVREAGDEVERLKKEIVRLEEDKEVEVSLLLEKLQSLEKMVQERFSLELEKSVVIDFVEGIAYDADQLLLKNVLLEKEKVSLISQLKELRELIEDLKRELGQTLDDNEILVLEKSVLVWLFRELKVEAEEAEEERKALLENFNNESRKVLELKTEAEYLNEILRQREDERSRHEDKLKLDVENLNLEFSVLQESYQNLQTQMAKVVEENTVLKDSLELKQQNHALCEDLMHQSELQLHEAKQNLVATQSQETSTEVLNYRKDFLSMNKQIYPKAVEVQLLKETKLDRIITVEKTVDHIKKFSTADDTENDIKHNVPTTLAEEMKFQYTVDDHRRICTIQHSTPHKTYSGLKVSAPRWGLKMGKSSSKGSSVRTDTNHADDLKGELREMEAVREKKHKGRISDFGKKLLPKNYLPKSRSATSQGQQESKK